MVHLSREHIATAGEHFTAALTAGAAAATGGRNENAIGCQRAEQFAAGFGALLQAGPQQEVRPVALLNPLIGIDRDTLLPASCWTIEEIRQSGG